MQHPAAMMQAGQAESDMAAGARQVWAAQVRARFPSCPGYYRDEIAERLAARGIPPGLERQAVE